MEDDDNINELEDETEQKLEKPGLDYDQIDEDTGFKKYDWQIWQAFYAAILSKPEDERDDEEEWADTYASENNLDKNRVSMVVKLGIYAGARDQFNQRTGEGKTIYSNGDEYEGQFWEGKKNGKGKYVFKSLGMSEIDKLVEATFNSKADDEDLDTFVSRASSKFFLGEVVVRFGIEHSFYPCFIGDYVNNLRHGKGIMKNKDGSVYKGDWKDNKRCGEGVYYFTNGDIYSGQWSDGLKHGHGTYTFANNKGEYAGVWDMGIFKEGQWIMSDGKIFEGKFDNKNRPCDPEGVIKFPKLGLMQKGSYNKGKWAPADDFIKL